MAAFTRVPGPIARWTSPPAARRTESPTATPRSATGAGGGVVVVTSTGAGAGAATVVVVVVVVVGAIVVVGETMIDASVDDVVVADATPTAGITRNELASANRRRTRPRSHVGGRSAASTARVDTSASTAVTASRISNSGAPWM